MAYMKNLLMFTNPQEKFDRETEVYSRIQIDNSLDLGWEIDDIVLATNFDYSYRGVKSVVVEDKDPCLFNPRNGKINALNDLFNKGVIVDNELYFLHDFDAWQLLPFDQASLGLAGLDLGLTICDHGAKYSGGVVFFSRNARDIWVWVTDYMYKNKLDEQLGFDALIEAGELNIRQRYKLLDRKYNVGIYKITHPIVIAHFHPQKQRHLDKFRQFLPDRLMNIFDNYGIK